MSETGGRTDPWPAFRFTVEIDDLPAAGFTECGGLEVQIDLKEHQEGGRNDTPLRFVTSAKPATLSFKRGIVDRRLWDWCFDVARGRIRYRGGQITVRAQSGDAAMHYRFARAIPNKWSGPHLDAGQSQVAMETLELAHHGLEWLD
jgi:phage tail-like protein